MDTMTETTMIGEWDRFEDCCSVLAAMDLLIDAIDGTGGPRLPGQDDAVRGAMMIIHLLDGLEPGRGESWSGTFRVVITGHDADVAAHAVRSAIAMAMGEANNHPHPEVREDAEATIRALRALTTDGGAA